MTRPTTAIANRERTDIQTSASELKQNSREYYGSTGENATLAPQGSFKSGQTMIALIQRVSRARVEVAEECVASAGRGILALVGIEADDTPEIGRRLLERVLKYRIFPDDTGRMNLDLRQIDGDLLLVPQFTLVADTRKGTRPGFSEGASPARARELFEELAAEAARSHPRTTTGVFGADMQVSLVNDGPVTFSLRVAPG
jgi:D-tyrosyl-tRNA(Tyr) deacylase